MNAYLFTGCISCTELSIPPGPLEIGRGYVQTWDACSSLVVFGESAETAQARFTSWLISGAEEDHRQTQVRTIGAAQFVDRLFTEEGPATLDWPQVLREFHEPPEVVPDDDFEKGYWVDVDQAVSPGSLCVDIESLQRELPGDIRSGLNWSADKQCYFIISALSLPGPPPEPSEEELLDDTVAFERKKLAELKNIYPELADKETAALIQARNSVVAAWLWRKFAADTPLVNNPIRIDPWCGTMEADPADDQRVPPT